MKKKLDRKLEDNNSEPRVEEKDSEENKKDDEKEAELEDRVDAIRENMDENNKILKELVGNFDKMIAYKQKVIEDKRVEDREDVVLVVPDDKRVEDRNLEDLDEKEDVILKEILEVIDRVKNENTARIQFLKKRVKRGIWMLKENKDF